MKKPGRLNRPIDYRARLREALRALRELVSDLEDAEEDRDSETGEVYVSVKTAKNVIRKADRDQIG